MPADPLADPQGVAPASGEADSLNGAADHHFGATPPARRVAASTRTGSCGLRR